MDITIKKMETDEEIRGKAFVHWRAWHEAYPGLVSREYLDNFTLEKCETMALRWPDNTLVAKDGPRVVGFIAYGAPGEQTPDTGEIFGLYVLSDYYGKGVGRRLVEAASEALAQCPKIGLWVLRGNRRAIRFYEKCGFVPNGQEMTSPTLSATEARMVLER